MHQNIAGPPHERRLPKDPVRVARALRRRLDIIEAEQAELMRLHDEAYAFADRMVDRVLGLGGERKLIARALDRLTINVTAATMRARPLEMEAA